MKDRNDFTSAEALALLYILDLQQPAKAQPLLSAVKSTAFKTHLPLTVKLSDELSADETLSLGEWYRTVGANQSEPTKSTAYHHAAACFKQYRSHVSANGIGKAKAITFYDEVTAYLDRTGSKPRAPVASRPKQVRGVSIKGALVAYSFDKNTIRRKGNVTYVVDLSGNNLHGTLFGGTPTSGRANEALSFDGQDDFIDCEPLFAELAKNHSALSITVWVKANSDKRDGYVFSVGVANTAAVSVFTSNGQVRYAMGTDFGGADMVSKKRIDDDWHHVVCSWDGKTQRIHIDGELDSENSVKPFQLTSNTLGTKYSDSGSYKGRHIPRIGTQAKADRREQRHFQGVIDEFAIFTRALSAAEIKAVYEQGKAGKSLGTR